MIAPQDRRIMISLLRMSRKYYETLQEMEEVRKAYEDAGHTTRSGSNPEKDEYWLEVMIEGELRGETTLLRI
jgi:hypothetical protein